ncbi:MAG: hypothetical protein AUG52_01270 [Verrucomicrobia bacterium 13_1_20CM_3_54_17]|nr:MAG: hypothetical protein AUG52_01270 [Verrucomicrobia bacterium 13_1_20CM_3_54_17]
MRQAAPSKSRFPLSPTTSFAGLLFVLVAIWYAASSQNNAASYLLLFALASVSLVSIPWTFSNMGGLQATVESVKPAFAGQEISLAVEVTNGSRGTRYDIAVALPDLGDAHERIDEIGRLQLTSAYPLGFLRVVKQLPSPQRYVVYPKPAGEQRLPAETSRSGQSSSRREFGEGDDFAGVRAYVRGESQRHIDWKAVARGQALMTKQFTAESDGLLYLDFAAVRLDDLEARLSQLTLWVIEAERARRPYGLRLPAIEIPPSLGEPHLHRCLHALALFK